MKTIWTEELDSILEIGVFLGDVGVNNWALTKEQAFIVLDQFFTKGIGVLGGDVYDKQNKYLQPNYDNWYYNNEKDESEFVIKSIEKAKNYIANYKNKDSFFVLVPNCPHTPA